MPDITIQGFKFAVPDGVLARYDGYFTPDAPENLKSTVRQTLTENLRNNFAKNVKDALNGTDTIPDDKLSELQTKFNEYAEKYEFGVRQAGAGRVIKDPVEREMISLAKEDIRKAYLAKHGEKIDKDQLAEAAEKLVDLKADDYRKRARAILRQKEQTGMEDLAAVGL